MKQPKILLLDEVTSGLDPDSELIVQQAIERLMEGRTTFIIASRLNTIINVDMIHVIKDGTIIECGTHKDLISREGFYKLLWERQQVDNYNNDTHIKTYNIKGTHPIFLRI